MGKKTRRGYLSQFPAHWKVYRMDKLLNRVKKKVDVKKTENYTQIGIRSHGKGIFYKDAVTGKELGNKSVFWVEPDCFVVNIVFAWEMAVAKTTQSDVGLIASHRFPMYKPKPELLELDFLLYYFKMPLGKYLLGLASPGGAGRNKTLGQKEFAELEICIPPVNEQKEIVSILKTWDKAITLKEKLIEKKKLQKLGLMQQLLSGEKRLAGFDSEWKDVKVKDIATIKYGKDQKSVQVHDGKYPIFGTGGILGYTNEFLHEGPSVMIGRKGTINKPRYQESPFWTVDTLFYTQINNRCFPKWLFYRFCIIDWSKYNEATGVPSLNASYISNILLKLPHFKEQQAIAEILSSADQEISIIENELYETVEQKRGLMQQLLTGKKQLVV